MPSYTVYIVHIYIYESIIIYIQRIRRLWATKVISSHKTTLRIINGNYCASVSYFTNNIYNSLASQINKCQDLHKVQLSFGMCCWCCCGTVKNQLIYTQKSSDWKFLHMRGAVLRSLIEYKQQNGCLRVLYKYSLFLLYAARRRRSEACLIEIKWVSARAAEQSRVWVGCGAGAALNTYGGARLVRDVFPNNMSFLKSVVYIYSI